jgi:hypothetical protein
VDSTWQNCAAHRRYGAVLRHSSAPAAPYALLAVAAGAPASALAFAVGFAAASVLSVVYFPDGSAPDSGADLAPHTATPSLR